MGAYDAAYNFTEMVREIAKWCKKKYYERGLRQCEKEVDELWKQVEQEMMQAEQTNNAVQR